MITIDRDDGDNDYSDDDDSVQMAVKMACLVFCCFKQHIVQTPSVDCRCYLYVHGLGAMLYWAENSWVTGPGTINLFKG